MSIIKTNTKMQKYEYMFDVQVQIDTIYDEYINYCYDNY